MNSPTSIPEPAPAVKRIERARAMLDAATVEVRYLRANRWQVTTHTDTPHPHTYYVARFVLGGLYRCNCSDFARRGDNCKHIWAVLMDDPFMAPEVSA